jgi:hypothetical protein
MSVLKAVEDLPIKEKLSDHKESIIQMRQKGYSYRECAKILNANGIKTDHTRIFKLIKGEIENES